MDAQLGFSIQHSSVPSVPLFIMYRSFCLRVFLCAMCLQCLRKPEGGIIFPGTEATDHHCKVLGVKPASSTRVRLTEPSLQQPPSLFFIVTVPQPFLRCPFGGTASIFWHVGYQTNLLLGHLLLSAGRRWSQRCEHIPTIRHLFCYQK